MVMIGQRPVILPEPYIADGNLNCTCCPLICTIDFDSWGSCVFPDAEEEIECDDGEVSD